MMRKRSSSKPNLMKLLDCTELIAQFQQIFDKTSIVNNKEANLNFNELQQYYTHFQEDLKFIRYSRWAKFYVRQLIYIKQSQNIYRVYEIQNIFDKLKRSCQMKLLLRLGEIFGKEINYEKNQVSIIKDNEFKKEIIKIFGQSRQLKQLSPYQALMWKRLFCDKDKGIYECRINTECQSMPILDSQNNKNFWVTKMKMSQQLRKGNIKISFKR
ncbi:unnamed protein product [Paramecium octaurelia]|uniref:Uncharacterized protein n=1 Tax=Paramecium octaurelia TaxID=43137 RepID=A0A8S1TLH5_PAROT|nr:unnamed protein product [Paramecium octaurelia]